MKRIKFEELKHMDMIYYVRGIMDHGKIRIVSQIRYVQNPDNKLNYVWTYLMTGSGNDPCLKISKKHIAICVHTGDELKSKVYSFKNAEFKRLFLHVAKPATELGRKGGKAGIGNSKKRGNSKYYRKLALKSVKSRRKKKEVKDDLQKKS